MADDLRILKGRQRVGTALMLADAFNVNEHTARSLIRRAGLPVLGKVDDRTPVYSWLGFAALVESTPAGTFDESSRAG